MTSRGARSTQSMAWLMSRMWTNGRHGLPSLSMRMTFSVQACPARSLTTRSKRWRGEAPKAVALRRKVGEKSSSAMAATSRSTRTLHLA